MHLDAPEVDVKETLDGGAQIVVIMLGMNNVIRPDMSNTPEAVARWASTYRDLIHVLRDRTHPRIIALATPTLYGEDESTPKNLLMEDMCKAMATLAVDENCVLLPVRDRFKQVLHEARKTRADFHIEADDVHPSGAGHAAIAMAMLEGLGEPDLAQAVHDRASAQWKASLVHAPPLSFELRALPSSGANDERTFKIKYWLSQVPAQVDLAVPEGWRIVPPGASQPSGNPDPSTGEFTVVGTPDHLRNTLSLSAKQDGVDSKVDIMIPAPWLLGIGSNGNMGWVNQKGFTFDPEQGKTSLDPDLSRGIGFDKPTTDPKWNRQIAWQPYFASINYIGGNDPGSVDLSAVSWFNTFDLAYGVRWIHSPSDRSIPIQIDSDAFTGGNHLTIWGNGEKQWESASRRGFSTIKLHKGWNTLVFRSNHLEWLWQFDIKLISTPSDDLSDLRFSIVPHEPAKP